MITRVRQGLVFGRFQPFHKGHLSYVRIGYGLSEELYVGIVTPPHKYLVEGEDGIEYRWSPEENPFTYNERHQMIKRSLQQAEDINMKRVNLVPFPLRDIRLWRYYLPGDIVAFIRDSPAFEVGGVDRLREGGVKTMVIDDSLEEVIRGKHVREAIINDNGWEDMVPRGVADYIREINGVDRLRKLVGKKA